MSILTMSILAVIFAIFLVICILIDDYNEGWKIVTGVIGGAGLFFLGIFGFGVHGTETGMTMIVNEIKADTIMKSNTTVYVEFEKGSYKREYIRTYEDDINDSTKFYKVTYFNLYGYENETFISASEKYAEVEKGKEVEVLD
jgi:hypothetical protein